VFEFLKKLPVVTCSGCNRRMKPGKPEPILFTKGLADVRFTCDRCGIAAVRTIKIDENKAGFDFERRSS
jgi:RNase P subunit RPR2